MVEAHTMLGAEVMDMALQEKFRQIGANSARVPANLARRGANNKKSASFREIFLERSGDTLRALQNFECEADPQHGDKPQQMVSDNHHR